MKQLRILEIIQAIVLGISWLTLAKLRLNLKMPLSSTADRRQAKLCRMQATASSSFFYSILLIIREIYYTCLSQGSCLAQLAAFSEQKRNLAVFMLYLSDILLKSVE